MGMVCCSCGNMNEFYTDYTEVTRMYTDADGEAINDYAEDKVVSEEFSGYYCADCDSSNIEDTDDLPFPEEGK